MNKGKGKEEEQNKSKEYRWNKRNGIRRGRKQ
jgi:hypothetical protein